MEDEARKKRQEEEARVRFLAERARKLEAERLGKGGNHSEREGAKQRGSSTKGGDESEGTVGESTGVRRCENCTRKGLECEWPAAGSRARSCKACRETKASCVVEGGVETKKRKERGSPEKVIRKKTKTAEVVARSSSSQDATPLGLNMSQQLILELQLIHRTLRDIHATIKEVSSQIDSDWVEEKESSSETEEESEEEGEENSAEEMTLEEEVMELEVEAKGKEKAKSK